MIFKSWRKLSMRGYLLLVVLAILVPCAIFAGILFKRYYDSQLANIDQELLSDALSLVSVIDRDLAGLQSALQTLSTSKFLADRDYAAFHEQSLKVVGAVGLHVTLRDLTGQQLVNTRLPLGDTLPRTHVDGDEEAVRTGRPVVSGVVFGAITKEVVYVILVPVLANGKVTHLLSFAPFPERLISLMNEVRGEERLAGILDRTGRMLVRIPEQEAYVGKMGPTGFFASAPQDKGLWQGVSVGGMPVRSAYATSRLAGWTIWVAVPEHLVTRALNRVLPQLAAIGALLTALALIVAFYVGGRISRSIRSLAGEAALLGAGQTVSEKQYPVGEIDEVGRSLVAASDELRTRAAQRDQAESELREFSRTLEEKVAERTQELVVEMRRREESEQTLRQMQKMEAIGQLTGGVAHDFNNMLAVVIGSLDLAQRRKAKGDNNIDRLIESAAEGARRAASLTQRLLAFARQQPLDPKVLDVNALVSGMSELLRRSLGETIQLETVLASGLWRVHVDANQIESAILNLAVNARDAMPEGGKLTLETSNAHFDDLYARREHVTEGQYVLIAVTDTGIGMPQDVVAKAFDPFFTTKKAGSGTGLGLSQVYGFVKQSGGHVKIYSEPGHGTTVKIYLPRHSGAAVAMETPEAQRDLPLGSPQITVLVVEDEAGVRSNTVEILKELRYNVLAADSAKAALKLIEAGTPVDLLFTDVVMPEMNGRLLAEAALAKRPELKVLFTTGYTKNAIVHNATLDPGVNFIGKPFNVEQVARKVADVLRPNS